jgi:DNA-binding response OmpR family regulator
MPLKNNMDKLELKVLLIEDNPGDAFLIKFYLGESTAPVFNVSHAETMQAGLELLANNKFDLILSDMNLPDSFGVETIKSILEKFPGNLVIVLTGLTDEAVGLETVRYGAQDFLVKGKFDGQVLISSVIFAFERFKLNRQIDVVSKKLDIENLRLDIIQRLLNVGYVEYNSRTNQLSRSDYALKLVGLTEGQKVQSADDAIALTQNPEQLKSVIKSILEKGGNGEFTYQKNSATFRMKFENHDGIFYGIVQKLEPSTPE